MAQAGCLPLWRELLTGASCFWEFTHFDRDCFEVFLHQLAEAFPESLNLLQLDNGCFHKAQRLAWPDNLIPILQPPHSPQLHPIERLWQHLNNFESLQQLHQHLEELLDELTLEQLQSLCGWNFITATLSKALL